jgi:hypothetical protein
MTHKLYDIWKDEGEVWHAQLRNYVANFGSEGMAQKYVAAIKKIAERTSGEQRK